MSKAREISLDICVIGTDRAGFDIAFAAAGLGVPVAVITQAEAGALMPPAPHDLSRLRALGVTILEGHGAFLDRDRFSIGDAIIAARRYVLATGIEEETPAVPALDDLPDWHAGEKAGHVAVFGSGAWAAETAQRARDAGARVTWFAATGMLADFDAEAAGQLLALLGRNGVVLRPAMPDPAQAVAAGKAPAFTHRAIEPATRPAIASLGLDAAGIAKKDGLLALTDSLRTTNRRVYAAGSVAMRPGGSRHGSAHAGIVLSETLFRRTATLAPGDETRLIATTPQLVEIGLAARDIPDKARGDYRYFRTGLADTGRGGRGFAKIITDRGGRIKGAVFLAPDALELAPLLVLAMDQAMKIEDMARIPIARPSHAEAIGALARLALKDKLATPMTRRLIRFLRIFG